MNKKLQILAIALLLQAPIFSMDHDTASQRELLRKGICRLQTAISKAACYSEMPEYEQNVELERKNLKRRFPQVVEMLPNNRVRIFFTKTTGEAVIYTM